MVDGEHPRSQKSHFVPYGVGQKGTECSIHSLPLVRAAHKVSLRHSNYCHQMLWKSCRDELIKSSLIFFFILRILQFFAFAYPVLHNLYIKCPGYCHLAACSVSMGLESISVAQVCCVLTICVMSVHHNILPIVGPPRRWSIYRSDFVFRRESAG